MNKKITICSFEILKSYSGWQCLLHLEFLVKILAKIWFYTQSLQQEDTHPDYSLLGCIELVLYRVEKDQDNKVVGSVSIDDERPEPLIALCNLPKQHKHLRCTLIRLLVSRYVRGTRVEWGIQNPSHAIDDELEILRSM